MRDPPCPNGCYGIIICLLKNIQGNRTVTTVRTLDHEQRKYEIARIMGGENITELMLENAEQYLKDADNM